MIITTRYERIHLTVTKALQPEILRIEDESHLHQVPKDAESHFKLTIISTHFIGLTALNRHRLVYSLIEPERQTGLHAISLALFTPDEWKKQPSNRPSPLCQHRKVAE